MFMQETDNLHVDNDLEHRMRLGDESALAEFFTQQRDRLGRLAQFRLHQQLHGRIDPDDVLQEAYLDANSRLHHFAKEGGMSAFVWLRLIVKQTLSDIHRRHLGVKKRSANREIALNLQGGAHTSAASLAAVLLGDMTSPSQAAVRAELGVRLEHALGALSERDQEVLVLRHFEELSNKEAAEVIGVEQKAASIRYVRALARLKAQLEDASAWQDELPVQRPR